MATVADRVPSPAYCSFKSFNSFFDDRRDDGHVTDVVDRSLMRNFAGSTAGELLSSLRYLGMIDEKGRPTDVYRQYVPADDATRQVLLRQALRVAYPYLLDANDFSIERATSQQVADRFREQAISGSTLVRAITFFLAAAKQAEIPVSPNIKPPVGPAKPAAKKVKTVATGASAPVVQAPAAAAQDGQPTLMSPGSVEVFDIPIPVGRKVSIAIPANFDADDWDFLQTMLGAYVSHWKKTHSSSTTKEVALAQTEATNDKGP